MTCITRFRLDAQLYAPAPPRCPGTNGRPRTKGCRLPALNRILGDRRTPRERVTVPAWYGEAGRDVDVATGTAVWYSGGIALPIRWVLVRDPLERFDPQALLCTDLTLAPRAVVR